MYKLGKITGKFKRVISHKENEKCKSDYVVFRGTSISEALDEVLKFKVEPIKIKIKILKYNIYTIAHIGSGFDTFVVLNKLASWINIDEIIKSGAGIILLEIFNGYLNEEKTTSISSI